MSVRSFFKLVEIQTKVASMIPFLLGTIYSLYRFNSFNLKNFVLMFVSLLSVDMATTAINNYFDFKRANIKYGYGYEKHNAIVKYSLNEFTVVITIFILLAAAVTSGILLFLNTNIAVLVLGAVSFAIGIIYSFGPVPISRTPLGEILSGGFMGFLITFIAAYIHVYDRNVANIALQGGILNIRVNVPEVFYLFLISLPAVVGISNIMLANNICDMEDDIENKRYTLPVYIGKSNALRIFQVSYYIAYVDMLAALLLRVAPLFSVIMFVTFIMVNRNIGIFFRDQSKKDTFILAVKNFVVMNAVLVLSIALPVIIRHVGK